jgi:hypothetical protein
MMPMQRVGRVLAMHPAAGTPVEEEERNPRQIA